MSHEIAIHVEHLVILLAVAVLIIQTAVRAKPAKRSLRRKGIAEDAIRYAEQMGGSSEQKKLHALGYAQIIDKADNGKRDYSDAELSVEIESLLGGK